MLTVAEAMAILGGIVAALTLIKAVLEYSSKVTADRAELFLERRAKLKESPILSELCDLVEADSPKLRETPFKDKLHLTGYFEEIALLVNSGLIRVGVAHYMFGYYEVRCWESVNFWRGLNWDATYWALLRDFVAQMKQQEDGFVYRRNDFRL